MSATFRYRLAALIGNVLEHYDGVLFALLAPFIAPLFFDTDPVQSLILTYAILPLGRLIRPAGALFFGWIGDHWGRKEALSFSLLGMGLATLAIGCLPTKESVGSFAPLFLALGRMVQSFFAAGETSGGAIFVLELSEKKKSFISSLFESSTVFGLVIASFLVMLMAHFDGVESYWRTLFWGGGATAFFALFLRMKGQEENNSFTPPAVKTSLWPLLFENKKVLIRLILASGFSYTTYAIPFTFLNGFIPMVTSYTAADLMKVNTILLIFDMLLLPVFGLISERFGKEHVMRLAAGISLAVSVPLFWFLNETIALFIPFLIVILGVAFSATYSAWALEQVPRHRYTLISFGYTLGSQLIGAPASFLCLLLYQQTGWMIAPGLYLAFASAGALFALSVSVVETNRTSAKIGDMQSAPSQS